MDASDLLRNSLLQLSKQEKIRDVIEKAPVSRSVVKRFVPGARARRRRRSRVRDRAPPAGCRPSTTSARTRPTSRRRSTPGTPTSPCSRRCATRASPRAAPPRCRSSSARSARRCPATATRSPSTTPARSARRRRSAGTTVTLDMEDHTTTDLDARRPARAAGRLPDRRRRAAGLPLPHRGRLP